MALDDPERLARLARDTGPGRAGAGRGRRRRCCRGLRHGVAGAAGAARRAADPGQPNPANAPAVVASIERATALCLAGEAGGVVTNPINKAALYQAGFHYPGHTEFLAALTGAIGQQIMMLASPI